MLTASIFILLFLGMRALRAWRKGEAISRRSVKWPFIGAAFLLILEIVYLSCFGFSFVYGSQQMTFLSFELPAFSWTLVLYAVFYSFARQSKDGKKLRWVLICALALMLGLPGYAAYQVWRDNYGSEPERYQQNLLRYAELIERGKREELARHLRFVQGHTLRELNENAELVLRKIGEGKP